MNNDKSSNTGAKRSGNRRKDYITRIALALFAFILIFEVLIVTWLPRKLITEALWEREVSLQEMVDLMDLLRNQIKHSIKFGNKWEAGEAAMALDSLNDIAKYLRANQTFMTRDQIREVYNVLKRFEVRFHQWKDNHKFCIHFEKIDIKPLLKRTLEDYNHQMVRTENDRKNRSTVTEKNSVLFQN